jgi:TolB-like protein/DNA-binding winged helix-turn-helix (wHTH) protein
MAEPTTTHLVYEFADFQVDSAERLLLLKSSGRPLPLSSKAFDALVYFLEHRGQLLEKGTLMAAIWPKVIVEENNLNQQISALRRLLGESRDDHRFIATIPGRGYRFVAEVTVRDASRPATGRPPDSKGVPAEPDAPTASSMAAVPDAVRPRAHFVYWVSGTAAALLLGAGLTWWLMHRQAPSGVAGQIASQSMTLPSDARVPRGAAKVRLAILPFENLSPEPANAFFTDGLYEEIVSTLAEQLRGVEVISRTTMASERLKAKPVAFLASVLGATHAIEGSVRREGQRVRVTLQLIDAETDQHVWSKSYDRTLESALTLQSEVAGELASQLSVQLSPSTPSSGLPTRDPEAYDEYLKAVVALTVPLRGHDFVDPERFRDADRLLTRAIARDPSFALAYAQRAIVATDTYQLYGSDPQRIRDDLERAKSLAQREPLVLGAEALYLLTTEENERALTALNAAEALGLTDPKWLQPKVRLLLRMGRVDEALRTQQHMLELDPGNRGVISEAAENLTLLRRPAEVLRVIQLLQPQWPDVYLWNRGRTLFAFTGRTQELRQGVDRWIEGKTPAQIAAHSFSLSDSFEVLRYEHRYRELDQLVQLIPAGPVNYFPSSLEYFEGHTDDVPAALYRGWSALLLGDEARAEREGRSLLTFMKTRSLRPAYFSRRLEAEGHVFIRQPAAAIEAASASLELMPRDKDAMAWIGVALAAARVYAWAGARERAVSLLEQVATASPGAPPAFITRDPLIALPLATDPHYQALAGRLEAQMTALNLN